MKKNIPKLRFKEFKKEWKNYNLKEIFDFSNGIGEKKENYGSGYKFINVLDIMNNNGIIYKNIIGKVNISKETFIKKSIKYGDLIFQRSSETKEGAGLSNVYIDKNQDVVCGSFVIHAKNKYKINYDPLFLHYLLRTNKNRKQIINKSSGFIRRNITQNTLTEISVNISQEKLEKDKIASFIKSFDIRLEQLNEKKKLLEEYTNGIIQQIFSQKIRFKKDDGSDYEDWKNFELGKIVDVKTGKKNANQGSKNGIYPFFTCSKKHIYSNSFSYDEEAILIAGNGEVGHCKYYNGKFEAYQRTYILSNFKENSKLIFNYLDKIFSREIKSKEQKGAMPYIKLENITKYQMFFPTNAEEQEKITNFLQSLANQIEQVEEQIEETTNYKNGLLQQMYV